MSEHIAEDARTYHDAYRDKFGLDLTLDGPAPTFDPDFSRRTAAAFDKAKHRPDNPKVKAAYDRMKQEILAQATHLEGRGVKLEPWYKPDQPYANSAEMTADARNNRHVWYFPTASGFGEGHTAADHPLYEDVPGRPGVKYNDLFRAVHDYFGHAMKGHQFGPRGELKAWGEHARMFSPLARLAMTAETHGQNSWVNFGPHAHLPVTERPFADQKATIMPKNVTPRIKLSRKTVSTGSSTWHYFSPGETAYDLIKARAWPQLADRLQEEGLSDAGEFMAKNLHEGHEYRHNIRPKGEGPAIVVHDPSTGYLNIMSPWGHHFQIDPEDTRAARRDQSPTRLSRSDFIEPTRGALARIIARAPNFGDLTFGGSVEPAGDHYAYQTPERDGTRLAVSRYRHNNTDHLPVTFPVLHVLGIHPAGGIAVYHSAPASPQEILEAVHQHSGAEEAKKFLDAEKARQSRPNLAARKVKELANYIARTPEGGGVRLARSDYTEPTSGTLARVIARSPNFLEMIDAGHAERADGDMRSSIYQTPVRDGTQLQVVRYKSNHPDRLNQTFPTLRVVSGHASGYPALVHVAPVSPQEALEAIHQHSGLEEAKKFLTAWRGRGATPTEVPTPVAATPEAGPSLKLARVDAVQDVTSRQQSIRHALAGRVMAEAGLKLLTANDVMTTGPNARASLVQQVGHDAEPDAVNYAAAWYGMLAKEPHLTVFHESPGGKSTLHVWKSPLGPDHVIDAATRMGLPGVAVGKDGTSYAFDPDSTRISAIRQLQGLTRATDAAAHRGTASNLGSSASAPSGARAHYREAIAAYERQADPGPSPARP